VKKKPEDREHPLIPELQEQLAEGKISRRQFLRYSTLLGLSAGAAYVAAGKITGRSLMPVARGAEMPKGGTIRIGMRVQEIESPHAYNWLFPAVICGQVCDRLALTGQDNITRPSLAERWEASDDLKTWTFHLRKINWHNGRPFTADDVVENFKHILDPATGSSSVGLMKGYMLEEYDTGKKDEEGKPKMSTRVWKENAIEKIDDHTVRFNLKVPQVAIPEHLDHYTNMIIDPEDDWVFGPDANGIAAFELVEHKVGIKSVLKARKEPFYREGPYVDTFEFVDLGDDPSANLAGLASKQVHGLYQLDITQLEAIKALPHVETHQANTASTAVVQMRVKIAPYDDPKVRKAIRHATNSKEVLRLSHRNVGLEGEHHFVCPIHPEYAPLPDMYDPAKARELLAEAGHGDGLDINIAGKKDPNWELQAVQVMVEQWREAGINCTIEPMPSAQFWDVWDQVPLGFVEWAHRPLGFMVLSLGFRTGVPWNAPEWSNKEFDELLTKAEGTLDVDERRKIMEKIELIMQEDGPIGQPVWRGILTGMDKRVKGYRMHPQFWFRANELAIES